MILEDFLHSVFGFGLAFLRVLIPASIAFWMVTYQRIETVIKMLEINLNKSKLEFIINSLDRKGSHDVPNQEFKGPF